MLYLVFLLSFFSALVILQLRWVRDRRRLQSASWESILGRIKPVRRENIQIIADCYLSPNKNQLRLEPNDMWDMLGGLEGIVRMKENAARMLDLAVYAERWNFEEARIVSEMIRRDAVRLNSAVLRIQLGMWLHLDFARVPFHMQEATASYYLIRQRLLGIYQSTHIGLLNGLQATV